MAADRESRKNDGDQEDRNRRGCQPHRKAFRRNAGAPNRARCKL
jgi:hypothetical protein